MVCQRPTKNYFSPWFCLKIGVSGLMIYFFVKPGASPVGNYLLLVCLRSRRSCLPFVRGSRLSCFLGAVGCRHELQVELAGDIAVVSDYLSYLHFLSTTVIGCRQDDHWHCWLILYLHVPFLMTAFDFYPVFVVAASIALCLLERRKGSLIAFCFQRLKMEIFSKPFRFVGSFLQY